MIEELCNYLIAQTPISRIEAQEMTEGLKVRVYNKGELLQQEGKFYKHMYFVGRGLLRSYTTDSSGKEHIIQFAPENWWSGDLNSMYFNDPSLFFIDAVEESEVVAIDEGFYKRAKKICPGFGNFHEHLLFNSMRHMQKRINLLLAATAEERYLDFMAIYPNIALRVPQLMIASYLGITPESLSRLRKALTKKNRIQK